MKIKSVILIIISVLILSSCASNKPVMKYGNAELSERIYSYWLDQYKSYFLSSSDTISDTNEFWNSKVSDDTDMTMDEYFTELADINIKKNLVCMKLFDEYGLSIPEETIRSIDEEIQDYIDSYGSKNEFNKMLAEYGINDKIYRDIYIIQEKIAMVFDYLFGIDGVRYVTDEEVNDYFINNYVRIKYITINLYEISEDGSFAELEADEREQRIQQSKDIYDELVNNGADFDTMFDLYSYDKLVGYSNGVYFSGNNAGSHDVIDKGLSLSIGEVAYVEDEHVAYIVKRLDLEDKPYMDDNIDQVQFTDLYTLSAESVFQSILLDYIDDIEIVDSVKQRYSIGNPVK